MNSLTTVFILTLAIFANFISPSAQEDAPTDTELAREIFECARKAIVTGIPEINVPSHDPLKIKENLGFSFDLLSTSITASLTNVVVEGIPWWNVTEAYQISDDDPAIDIFHYNVYWKSMVITGDWRITIVDSSPSKIDEGFGTISIELDHINFSGTLNFTKPGYGREETFGGFTLDITTEEAEAEVTNLGIIGDLVSDLGGQLLPSLVSSASASPDLADAIRQKVNTEWIQDPERIQVLIDHCRE